MASDRSAKDRGAQSSSALLARLSGFARPYLGLLAIAMIFSLLFAGARYGRAYLMKPLLDDVLLPAGAVAGLETPEWLPEWASSAVSPGVAPDSSTPVAAPDPASSTAIWDSFQRVLLIALAIVVVSPIALFGRTYLTQYALGRIAVEIKQTLANKLLSLPLTHHRETRSGDMLTRILADAERSQDGLKLIFGDLLQAVIMVLIGSGTLLVISWQLSLISLVAAPPIVGVLAYFSSRVRRTAGKRQDQLGEVTGRLVGILSGIRVIKAFRGNTVESRAFARETDKLFRRDMKVVKNTSLSRSLIEMLNHANGVGILFLGSMLVLHGRWGLSTGDVAAFATVLATTYRPIKTLARGWGRLMEATASADRFLALLDEPEEPPDPADAVRVEAVDREIRFDRVWFSYGREPVLRDFSLSIRAGEVVALVGPTGAGKSTVVDLLLRFSTPDSGTIEIDGIDVRNIARNSLLDVAAVVTQEPFLFDTTIRENIAYGRPDASPEAFAAAVRTAHVDEFVDQLPQGYETEVGEFGVRLSGGQRQRITIARAVLKNASLLLLDEATSALDAKTERTVQNAIEAMRGERTILVIAHRLSTLRCADRIVVVENGTVTSEGTHADLMAGGGLYPELVALQE